MKEWQLLVALLAFAYIGQQRKPAASSKPRVVPKYPANPVPGFPPDEQIPVPYAPLPPNPLN